MDYEQIKKRLAPCGLHCGRCFAFTNGDIKKHSEQLKGALGNFDVYAQRFVDLLDEPVFKKYPDFKAFLNHLSSVECKGCRDDKCKLFERCRVKDCYMEKGVDFCFQCDEFPCNRTGFDEHLHNRSVAINKQLREIGVEAYFNKIKDKPRY